MSDRDPIQLPAEEQEESPAGDVSEQPDARDDAQSEAEPPVPSEDAAVEDDRKSWYIIHTYSGFERKVRDSLRTRAEAFGFAEQLGEILIPEEEVVEMRAGKKVTSKRMLYPGYVIVQMEMSDEMRHYVKDTPRVTGFVGGGTEPVPLTPDEVNKILYRQATAADRPRPKLTFEKNETVRIVDGPFANFTGKVDEVNTDRSTLRVLVTIFGRATPVELDFLQVEKT
jgi:transcription termination/antitermination protein NusG